MGNKPKLVLSEEYAIAVNSFYKLRVYWALAGPVFMKILSKLTLQLFQVPLKNIVPG